MFIIKRSNGQAVLDGMTEKPREFRTREEARSYADLSRFRAFTIQAVKS